MSPLPAQVERVQPACVGLGPAANCIEIGGLDFLRDPTIAIFFGGGLIAAYYAIGVIFWVMKKDKMAILKEMGVVRYGITAFLFLTMMALPIKMILRWTMNIKYILVIKGINFSI
jgi:hypothetical protein